MPNLIAELSKKIEARKEIIQHVEAGMFMDNYLQDMLLNINDNQTLQKCKEATKDRIILILSEANKLDELEILKLSGGKNG